METSTFRTSPTPHFDSLDHQPAMSQLDDTLQRSFRPGGQLYCTGFGTDREDVAKQHLVSLPDSRGQISNVEHQSRSSTSCQSATVPKTTHRSEYSSRSTSVRLRTRRNIGIAKRRRPIPNTASLAPSMPRQLQRYIARRQKQCSVIASSIIALTGNFRLNTSNKDFSVRSESLHSASSRSSPSNAVQHEGNETFWNGNHDIHSNDRYDKLSDGEEADGEDDSGSLSVEIGSTPTDTTMATLIAPRLADVKLAYGLQPTVDETQ